MVTSTIHVPFAGGLDEKIAKEYLDPNARLASVLNGDFVKVGTIDKRKGMAHLSSSLVSGGLLPVPTSGIRVVGWSRSSLSLFSAQGLYQYVSAPVGGTSAGGLVGIAKIPSVFAKRSPLPAGDQPAPATVVDLTYSGSLLRIAVFWDAGYNLQATVTDVASGDVVLEPTQIYANTGVISGSTVPYVVSGFDLPGIANGNPRTVVVLSDYNQSKLYFVQYNPSTNAFTAPTLIGTSWLNTAAAAVPYEDDPANGWLILYQQAANNIRFQYWTNSGLQTTLDQAGAGKCLVAGRYGQSVFTVWGDTSVLQRNADHTFASGMGAPFSLGAAGNGVSGLCHLGTNKAFLTRSQASLIQDWHVLSYSAGTITNYASGYCTFGLYPLTQPFVVSGEVYQPLIYCRSYNGGGGGIWTTDPNYNSTNPNLQLTLYLCKYEGVTDTMASGAFTVENCRPVATIAPRTTGYTPAASTGFILASNVQRNATRVAVGIKTQGAASFEAGGSWAADFFWDSQNRANLYQASEIGAELSVSGGVPFVVDDQTAFEDGFFNFPELTTVATAVIGGGGGFSAGNYSVAVCYRHTDSSGLTHRSAPYICAPVTMSGAPTQALNITIPPPISSYRDSAATSASSPGRIIADIYITQANGSTFYLVTNINQYLLVLSNKLNVTGVTIQITAPPVTTNPLLYTTGGVLDNVNPPASRLQIVHQNRKAILADNGREVWFSKEFAGGDAPGFNEALVVPFPEGGDGVALASMDGKFICFKQRSIWIMEGTGPSVTGQGSSWTEPEAISTDVGCVSWQSVVLTPKGLMFQAPNNGIYLLGRDLQVTFIGKSVIDRTSAYPNIVSASLVPNSTHVRFVCQDAVGANHLVVVYDYLLDQWTTHQYGQVSAVPVSSCVTYGATPQYTVLTSDGQLWQERLPTDAALYLDQDSGGVNHFVPTTVKMPYVKMQVQGFQSLRRVQVFGEQQDDCGLQMQLAFNYDDTVRQTANWASTQLKTLPIRGQVEAFVDARYNKQMSVQVTLSDTAGAAMTNGAGMRFVAAALELQSLGSRYPMTPAGGRR